MPGKQVAPYGSWKSPISAELIATKTIGVMEASLDDKDIYWLETRPSEGGRYVIVRRTPDGATADVNPPPFNARTRVHEYGGGSYLVDRGTVYFSNFADQRLYRVDPGGEPRPITPEGAFRYADGDMDRARQRIVCVREDHASSDREAVNTIVSLPVDGVSEGTVLVSGNDFYSTPRLDPSGTRLCWLTWNHPNMPWDGTELWVANLDAEGAIVEARKVAGGPDESIFQPEWSPDGVLYFVSDRTGWWNIYRLRGDEIEPCTQMEAEFGVPQWVLADSTYAFASAEQIVCAYTADGHWHMATLDTGDCDLKRIDTPYTYIESVRATASQAICIAASPTEPLAVIALNLATGDAEVLKSTSDLPVDPAYLPDSEALRYPSEGGRTSYAFYYAPKNGDFEGPSSERPPLVVMSHGGPTAATFDILNLGLAYFTSRGIAVVDVNYGGSTGYGREYRNLLRDQWGIVDVDDCVNAALYLAEQGKVDANRLAIRGGSAGGYTTLAALTFRDAFKAGASYFGISELETLATDTHKFESRYLDGLVAPYPEHREVYVERSPIHHVDRLSSPIIFFQGLEDKVVPPDQAEKMVEALRKKHIPVAYMAFEGEQHGFRKAETVRRTKEAEAYFYSRVFGFALADDIEPVEIENL